MNIALITYDENVKHELVNKLAGNSVKTYVDSISMLKDLDEFNPGIIIYDASAGDFAFDDLKFLISRDKVKGKKFKVLYSKLNPLNKDKLEEDNIEFYVKEEDLDKLVSEVLREVEESIPKEDNLSTEEIPEFDEPTSSFSPEDIENFYQNDDTSDNIPEFENMFSNTIEEELTSFQEPQTLKEFQVEPEPEKSKPNKKESQPENDFSIPQPVSEPQYSTQTINISLDLDDIKKGIVMVAVDKLVENIKNEPEIKELTDNIATDFVSRIEEELESLKEEIKNEVRKNIFSKLEEEITAILKQDLKDYIADITSKLVKEKLDQIFNK